VCSVTYELGCSLQFRVQIIPKTNLKSTHIISYCWTPGYSGDFGYFTRLWKARGCYRNSFKFSREQTRSKGQTLLPSSLANTQRLTAHLSRDFVVVQLVNNRCMSTDYRSSKQKFCNGFQSFLLKPLN
jgi:hypothetical protein